MMPSGTSPQRSHGDPSVTTPFSLIDAIWTRVFLEGEEPSLAERVRGLEASVCGFTHAVLYIGPRLMGDLLVKIAREQVAAMDTITALTDRSAPMYFALTSAHDFLYVRCIPSVGDISSTEVDPTIEAHPRPLFFAILGKRDDVLDVSGRLDGLLDRLPQVRAIHESGAP